MIKYTKEELAAIIAVWSGKSKKVNDYYWKDQKYKLSQVKK